MAITKKKIVAFALTILIVISFVHCRTSDSTSGFGIKESDYSCYTSAPCEGGGERGCTAFCTRMHLKPGPGQGRCNPGNICCCAIN
ncbi:hypothetical protein EUTSA_v10012291mg [Eutrema salsugineum]|uniref:Uncharacterized protein n=1 Tax=Eutrema salsugineum TaxID=72664 RepID=V4JXW6_EUTSA|nr:putative defensin-like protein 110 [Eutrema salsugineum]ESQ30340.1 hypothetical protein EUTSA_v10012291mg [Eutrema salsugineum]